MRGRLRRTKRWLFHGAVRFLQLLATVLPRRVALATFAAIGELVRVIDRPAMRRAMASLEVARRIAPTEQARRRIASAMFAATGRNLVDLFRMPRLARSRISDLVRFEGLENLDAALARGRGAVILSAHLGNWEVLGAALAARGIPLSVMVSRLFDRRSDRLLNEWRRGWGVSVIPSDGGLLPAARALRRGEVVGMLVDQDSVGSAVFAEFFGKPARTPVAPFLLGRRMGAPLVPVWIHLDSRGVHQAKVLPELEGPAGEEPEEALMEDVTAWHRILENAIATAPEQWVWHHRRWKSHPPSSPSLRKPSKQRRYLARFQRPGGVVGAR